VSWARVLLNLRQDEEAKEKYEKAYKIACTSLNTSADRKSCASVLVSWAIGLSIMSGDAAFKKDEQDAALYNSYLDEAFKKYEEASKVAPENPEVFSQWGYELALKAIRERAAANLADAATTTGQAIEKFEKFTGKPDADFYNYWGTVLAMMGDYEMSIEKRRQAIATDPKSYLAYYSWGLDLYYQGRQDDDRGDIDEATEKYRQSISRYKQSIYINPKFADAYYRLGVSFITLRVHEQAIKQFQKAIELDPRHPYAYSDSGYALEQLGKYKEAIETYKEAIRVNPTYPPPYEGWVKSLEALSEESADDREIKKELAKAYNGWGWALTEICRRSLPVEKCNEDKLIREKYEKARQLGGESSRSGSDGKKN